MAIFGEGLSGDPLAEARAADIARARKTRAGNIKSIGEGRNAFQKGVGALSVVAGEHIGAAIAGAFGYEKPDSPDVAAAKKQAGLLEQINLIEEDPASAEYSKEAARLAMEAGDQQTAFGFAQQAGKREQVAGALEVKTEQARVKTLAENFARTPNSTQLDLIAGGNDDVRRSLNLEEGPEWDALIKGAKEQKESNIIRNKAAADKIRRTRDTSVTAANIKSTLAWLPSANVSVFEGISVSEEDETSMREAVAMEIASGANKIMVDEQEAGNTISNSVANDMSLQNLIDTGRIIVEVGTGTSMWGLVGEEKGRITVVGFGLPKDRPAELSGADQKAADWAAANPDDPRAAKINQKLGL